MSEIAVEWHERNLSIFHGTPNGNRNDTLNIQALKSFSLALGSEHLSTSQVEADYTSAAIALQMEKSSYAPTLRSALSAATPHEFYDNGNSPDQGKMDKSKLILAPVYTALEDYALAHGVPVSAFEKFQWVEGEHQNRKCLQVPHEDGVTRARFLDGENPKWKPIGSGHKPCWYSFKQAVSMATETSHKTIVLCNGQPSVVVGQNYGIAALAQTDGENKKITPPLLKRLLAAIKEHKLKVMIVFDGDDTGREATKKILEQLRMNKVAVSAVYFGGDDGYDLADHCKRHGKKAMSQLQRLAAYSVRAVDNEHKNKRLDYSMEGILAADENIVSPGEAVLIPFKSFHKYGGYAHMTAPGKMAMIMAPSGHGKTSFMETWADYWLKSGVDILWYSPEWEALETYFRRIQRNGGATYDQMQSLILYRNETARNVSKSQRQGGLLPSGVHEKTNQVRATVMAWPGDMFIYRAQSDIETVLAEMTKRLQLQRREGRRVGVAIFDYMQLLHTAKETKGKNSYEVLCALIKQWCIDNHIFALVGVQVTKTAGRNGNDLLGQYDAQWVRSDVFNLIVTLNIPTIEKFDDGVGVKQLSKIATANICKNSTGKTGEVQLKTNFEYLCWEDVE